MRICAVLFTLCLLAPPWGVSTGLAQDVGLPELIRETEKGVFFLRVLDADGKLVSSGTAFLVDGKGTLVTALHVIRGRGGVVGAVEAVDKDGKSWAVSGVTAHDESVDLVRLRTAKVPKGAKPLALGGDQLPERGATVLVLGHPQGFQFVATNGIVSATHKTEKLPAAVRRRGLVRSDPDVVWIQTTAPVAGGNSGGPMLDGKGKTIGVVQWITGAQGMNFGVHVASVRKLLARPVKLERLEEFTKPDAEYAELMREFASAYRKFQMENSNRKMMAGFAPREKGQAAPPTHPSVKFAPKFLALAETYRGKSVEFRLLSTLMGIACEYGCPEGLSEDVKKASDRLIEQYKDDRQLLRFLQNAPRPTLFEAQRFLGRLAKRSKVPEISAPAAFLFSRSIEVNSEERLRATALKWARFAAESDAEFTLRGEPVAELGSDLVEMLTQSAPGCAAPKLAGADQHGEALELGELRGQHVVVAFYTEASEFQSGISRKLNDIVSRYAGAPLSTSGVLVKFPNRQFSSSGGRVLEKTWRALNDDADGSLREAWHINEAPTVFLIDDKGVITGRFTTKKKSSGMGFGSNFSSSFASSFGGFPSSAMAAERGTWMGDLIDALERIPAIADPGEKLIPKSHEGWKYFEGGQSPGENWLASDFDDSEWKTGQAPLGYGEEDLKTTIGYGGNADSKNRVAFFRTRFEIDDPSRSAKYAAKIRCDDGAVVHLNGVEVFRRDVDKAGGGAIESQFASSTAGSAAIEQQYWFFEVDGAGLQAGANVIAVSVHQVNGSSSDLTLDLQLLGVDAPAFEALRKKAKKLESRFARRRPR
jgi:hypothetical protein